MTLSCLAALGRGGLFLLLIKVGFTLKILIQPHMHIAEYTMRLGTAAEWGQKWKTNPFVLPECWGEGVLLLSACDYQDICMSQRTNEVPVSGPRQPTLYFSEEEHLAKMHAPLARAQPSRICQRSWMGCLCVLSYQRALYPGPCQLVVLVICAPPSWLIHSHSRRRAALAAMLPATVLQECRGSSDQPLLTFLIWIPTHTQYLHQ